MTQILNQLIQLDTRAYLYINHLPHPPWLNILFISIDILSNYGIIWIIFCLTLIFFGNSGQKTLGKWGLLIVLLTTLFEGLLIKTILIARPRPFITLPDARIYGIIPKTFSFPSGQAANAFAVATFYSLVLKRKYFTWIFFTLALLTAIGRVYLGAHYPVDILVGTLIGITLGYLYFRAYRNRSQSTLSEESQSSLEV